MRYILYSENDDLMEALFPDLPGRLYPPERLTQDVKTELQLLRGEIGRASCRERV